MYWFFIHISVTAQPICLPETWLLLPNNAVLVGWGKAAGQLGNVLHIYIRIHTTCNLNLFSFNLEIIHQYYA